MITYLKSQVDLLSVWNANLQIDWTNAWFESIAEVEEFQVVIDLNMFVIVFNGRGSPY